MRGNPRGKRVLVVGLGNPGKGYVQHRHNLGFMVADTLADARSVSWTRSREKALVAEIRIDDHVVTLAKPQTYMNLSGRAVAPLIRRLNADPERMIVVHDDLDLTPGRVRIKCGGGDGGHRGVRSIADSLRFRDFTRVRIGVGRPPEGTSAEDFVLSGFTPEEADLVGDWVRRAGRAVELVVSRGWEEAKNLVHSDKIPPPVPTAML